MKRIVTVLLVAVVSLGFVASPAAAGDVSTDGSPNDPIFGHQSLGLSDSVVTELSTEGNPNDPIFGHQ